MFFLRIKRGRPGIFDSQVAGAMRRQCVRSHGWEFGGSSEAHGIVGTHHIGGFLAAARHGIAFDINVRATLADADGRLSVGNEGVAE